MRFCGNFSKINCWTEAVAAAERISGSNVSGLRRAKMARAGAEFVLTRYTAEPNIGTTFAKIVERAGLVPWDKSFQNLRATRETELMAAYSVKDVSSWLEELGTRGPEARRDVGARFVHASDP